MADNYYDKLAQRATTDEDAFEELYEYFFPRVYNFIYARVKNSADADDITSMTSMKMNENLERYNPAQAAFSTWLFRIALNSIIDHTRRVEKNQETEWEEFFDPAAPSYQEPEAQVLDREGHRELFAAIDKLNERERQIVELRYFSDMDTRIIAAILQMSEGNVRTTLHRTLAKLKKLLSL